MRVRYWVLGALLPLGSLAGCDCGSTPIQGTDASPPVYDAGPEDAAAIDAVGTDRQGADLLAADLATADAVAVDASADDATRLDTSVGDAARTDSAGVDLGAADAARSDAAGSDAAHADVTGSDGARADAALPDLAGVDVAGPLPPSASAGGPYFVLPGASVQLLGLASDPNPGDVLSYAWEPDGGTFPVGVSLSGATTLSPTVTITRSAYEGGPQDLELVLRLTVIDSTGLSATAATSVTILDERGPHVANTSTYAGTGYLETGARHGYCGVRAHPCAGVDDALANLRGALADGAAFDPWLLVATTGTDYARGGEILLDDGLGIVCGYDPATWTRAAGANRTPLRFSGQNGVHITTDVLLEGCDVEGAAAGSIWAERAAVFVDQATATIRDNRLVANNNAGNGIGLRLDSPSALARSQVTGNDIAGGAAQTVAIGLQAIDGVPNIADNSIDGGSAPNTLGLFLLVASGGAGQRATVESNDIFGGTAGSGANAVRVERGDPLLVDNPSVIGGTGAGLNIGVAVVRGADRPTISGNTVTGVATASSAAAAIAVFLEDAADLSGNDLLGGLATYTGGLVADGNPDDDPDPNDPNSPLVGDFDFTSTGDTIVGGSGSFTVGVSAEDGARGVVEAPVATAASPGSSPISAAGALVGFGSTLGLVGGAVASGDATALACGALAELGSVALSILGSQVSGGVARAAGSSSYGVRVEDALLTIADGTGGAPAVISAGEADAISDGVAILCGGPLMGSAGHSISGATVAAGHVRGTADDTALASTGVYVVNCGTLTLSDNAISAGEATRGVSYGLSASATAVHSSNDSFTAGNALGGLGHSAGARVERGALLADSITAVGASGSNSHGIWLFDASGSNVTHGEALGGVARVERSNGVRVTASLGQTIDDVTIEDLFASAGRAAQQSFGVYFGNPSRDCALLELSAQGGPAYQSAGAYFTGGATQSHERLRVVGGTYTGGEPLPSSSSTGAPPTSVGLHLFRACAGCAVARVRAFGGDVTGNTGGVSMGARVYAHAPLAAPTFVYSSYLVAGDAPDARGVQLDGSAGDTLRLLNNTIDGGGRSGGTSYGVRMGWIPGAAGANIVGVVVGNIIGAGLGSASYNLYEDCTGSGGGKIYAEPFAPGGGRNNNLWPQGTVLLHHVASGGGNCSPADVTRQDGVDAVNGIVPYDGDVASSDRTWSVDPSFDAADLPHLLPGSPNPMEGLAFDTLLWWINDSAMVDIDAQPRPAPGGSTHDIGCDEL